ncbi:cbb3-type cytochrome c oxidase subunit 3 [Novosphingobium sp. ZN18A2]|uniref:cbb3-type cytochrome c oxidase subunit 3 n=1 Tax=Novosphingobium sp. ZN18A2 TaxID=3079861 RepID=UPI0030CEE600
MTGFEHSIYEGLRHFADSIGLAFMALVFLGLAAWVFRPGSTEKNRAAANMIFNDDEPGEEDPKKENDDGR